MTFSFRFKFQLIMITTLLTVLTAFLYKTSHYLEQDKTASLYDTSVTQTTLAENRVSRRLASLRYWLNQTLHSPEPLRSRAFKEKHNLAGLAIENSESTNWIYRSPEFSDPLGSVKQIRQKGHTFDAQSRVFHLQFSDNAGANYSSYWKYDALDDVFGEINQEGFLALIGDDGSTYLRSRQKYEQGSLVALHGIPHTKESRGFETRVQDEDHIVATARLENFPGVFALGVPKKNALVPVRELRTMSISLALMLIAAAGLVTFWTGSALTKNLEHLRKEAARIASGDLSAGSEVGGSDEVGDLSRSINAMTVSLKSMLDDVAAKGRMESELRTAQLVQETLMPSIAFENARYEVHGVLETASECGGDFWQYWQPNESSLFVLIADATGHGAPAALITSALRATTVSLNAYGERDLSVVLKHLHLAVGEISKSRILMTAIVAELNLKTGEFTYYNCSHERPLRWSRSRSEVNVISGARSPQLGDPNAKPNDFQKVSFILAPGDQLLMYTDGLIDGIDPTGRPLNAKRLVQHFTQCLAQSCPPRETLKLLIEGLSQTVSGPRADDITAVVISRKL